MAEFSSEEALAIVKAFVQASVHDRDEAAVKALVTRASAEQGNFNPPPNAAEMRIDIGQPSLDGAEWVVPVSIINPNDDSQPAINTPFTLTQEDGRYKIDMIRTVERIFGGGMNAVMDGVVDALKGVGEAMAEGMKQAFDGLGEALGGAFDDPRFQGCNTLPENASPQMADIFNRFHEVELQDQLNLMREAIGNETLKVYINWHSFEGDEDAAAHLKHKVLDTVRSAVCLSCSDDKTRDALREHLHAVVIEHIPYPEGKQIRLMDGRLEITTHLNGAGPGIGYHTAGEVTAAIREGLDLDKGPAIDRLLAEVVPQLKEEIRRLLDLDLEFDIDIAGFTEAYDTDTAVRHLERLESDLFRNFVYILREVNEKFPLADLLTGFRIEHVGAAAFRTLHARGGAIIIRINFTEEGGFFHTNELESLLPGVAASLPDHSDPASRSGGMGDDPIDMSLDAFTLINRYRDDHLPELLDNLQRAIEKLLDIEIDWAGIDDDAFAVDQLVIWGLNRVTGAFRLVMRDQQARQDLYDFINTIRIFRVQSVEEKRIELDNGILTLHLCLGAGEAGCFYECDIAQKIISGLGSAWKPIIEDLRNHAEYWENELAGPAYDAPVAFAIDFAGFTTAPDDTQVSFALTQLREHGIDALYYAITRLFESNPNFKQQFQRRVRRLIINHAPDPAQKNLGHCDDAIIYQTHLHQGYKGYLTIDEMVKRLPGIVAEMNDINDGASSSPAMDEPMEATETEADELSRMAAIEDRISDEQDGSDAMPDSDDDRDANAEAFAQVRQDMEGTLPNLSQSLAGIIGKPIPITIDWVTLDNDPVAVGLLLNACLSPIMTGFMELSQHAAYRADAVKYIREIVLARAAGAEQQALRLHDGVLSLTVFLDPQNPMPLSTKDAPAIFRGLIDYIRASGAEPAQPPKPRTKATGGAKKTPAKPAGKTAAKPAAKAPKKAADGKGKKAPSRKKGKGGKS